MSNSVNNKAATTTTSTAQTTETPPPYARHCHIVKRIDFDGYGFNLHSEKIKPGQYIGKVDEKSPAELAGLKEGDRIIEVNGVPIGNETHKQVVQRIKAIACEVRLLLIDPKLEKMTLEMENSTSDAISNNNNNNKSTRSQSPSLVDGAAADGGSSSAIRTTTAAAAAAPETTKSSSSSSSSFAGTSSNISTISLVSTKRIPSTNANNSNGNGNASVAIAAAATATATDEYVTDNGGVPNNSINKNGNLPNLMANESINGSGNSSAASSTNNNSNNNNNNSTNSSKTMTSGGLNLPLTAAEMRAKLMAKKKFDPKNESLDLKKKFEIIQKL